MVRALAKMKSLRLAFPRSNLKERKLRGGAKRQLKDLRVGTCDGVCGRLRGKAGWLGQASIAAEELHANTQTYGLGDTGHRDGGAQGRVETARRCDSAVNSSG